MQSMIVCQVILFLRYVNFEYWMVHALARKAVDTTVMDLTLSQENPKSLTKPYKI